MFSDIFYNSLYQDANFKSFQISFSAAPTYSCIGNILSHNQHSSFPLSWFESPYGYPGISVLNEPLPNNPSLDKLILSGDIVCIFIRPSISNLLDSTLLHSLSLVEYEAIDGGNDIFLLDKRIHNCSIDQLVSKKRLSKVRKALRSNYIQKFTPHQLACTSLWPVVHNIYSSLMECKNASSFYSFSNIWSLPSALLSVDALFYLSFDKITNDITSFILTIGGHEKEIFLSASNSIGRQTDAPSLLRYLVITDFLNSPSSRFLNMGGVNARLGGDESFKSSFGGIRCPYKIITKINLERYSAALSFYGCSYDPQRIRFWL